MFSEAMVETAHAKGWILERGMLVWNPPSPPKTKRGKTFKSHCKRGHPLSGSNLYKYKGSRRCKKCHRLHMGLTEEPLTKEELKVRRAKYKGDR